MELTRCTECGKETSKPYYQSDTGRATKQPRCRECYERGVSRDTWGEQEVVESGWGKLIKGKWK